MNTMLRILLALVVLAGALGCKKEEPTADLSKDTTDAAEKIATGQPTDGADVLPKK